MSDALQDADICMFESDSPVPAQKHGGGSSCGFLTLPIDDDPSPHDTTPAQDEDGAIDQVESAPETTEAAEEEGAASPRAAVSTAALPQEPPCSPGRTSAALTLSLLSLGVKRFKQGLSMLLRALSAQLRDLFRFQSTANLLRAIKERITVLRELFSTTLGRILAPVWVFRAAFSRAIRNGGLSGTAALSLDFLFGLVRFNSNLSLDVGLREDQPGDHCPPPPASSVPCIHELEGIAAAQEPELEAMQQLSEASEVDEEEEDVTEEEEEGVKEEDSARGGAGSLFGESEGPAEEEEHGGNPVVRMPPPRLHTSDQGPGIPSSRYGFLRPEEDKSGCTALDEGRPSTVLGLRRSMNSLPTAFVTRNTKHSYLAAAGLSCNALGSLSAAAEDVRDVSLASASLKSSSSLAGALQQQQQQQGPSSGRRCSWNSASGAAGAVSRAGMLGPADLNASPGPDEEEAFGFGFRKMAESLSRSPCAASDGAHPRYSFNGRQGQAGRAEDDGDAGKENYRGAMPLILP